ncbi:MAG TPA: hypothetical protein VK658_14500 [Chryseolinea sp.]|nr:hypothetical protein [Chryseolinea sp.]
MKRPFLAVLLALLYAQAAYCQSLQVELGPVVDPKEMQKELDLPRIGPLAPFRSFSYSTSLFFDPSQKKTYSGFGFQGKSFYFGVLENYLKYSGVKKLTAENINEEVSLNAFIVLNKKMYILYSLKYPKQDGFSAYVNEVSPDMIVLGSPIALHSFKDLDKYGMNVFVSSSEDKKYILITRILNTKSKETQKLECKVIDDSFSEVWYTRVETESTDKELTVQSVKVDGVGNMHALVEFDSKKINKPVVYSYFWKAKALKIFEPGLPTGVNFGTRLELLKGTDPYIVGLNDEQKQVKYFVDRINMQSQTLEKLGSQLMPEDFRKLSNFRVFETKHWGVMDIVMLDNDAIVASIEAIVVDSKYGQHHSYNAYVYAFRKDGSQIWSRIIQKKQITLPGFAGHMLIPAKDQVFVVYNDLAENLPKDPDVTKVSPLYAKNPMPVAQKIDASGKATKFPLTKAKDFEDYALNFRALAKIEKGLYFNTTIKRNGMYSFDSRNATIKVVD